VAFEVSDVYYLPIAVDHIVPTVGFLVSGPSASFLYSSDTVHTERIWQIANATPSLKAVFLECSFRNSMEKIALISKHLVPSMAAAEIRKLKRDVPVFLYHLKPPHIKIIQAEIRDQKDPRLDFLVQDKEYLFD